MSLPLPLCPDFRKSLIQFWLDDVQDRLDLGDLNGGELSWKEANSLYLSLPPGHGDSLIENRLVEVRVNLTSLTDATNENSEQQRTHNHN